MNNEKLEFVRDTTVILMAARFGNSGVDVRPNNVTTKAFVDESISIWDISQKACEEKKK